MLDPACGSGNFLYLALQALKDLEHQVQFEAEALGFPRQFSCIVGPANVKGIEINPYAAELARVSVWIGEIQWMRRNGYSEAHDPILKPLGTIDRRHAAPETRKAVYMYALEPAWRDTLQAPAPGVLPLAVGDGLDAASWAGHEFGGARLGDARLSARLVLSAEQMAESPMRAITGAANAVRALVKGHYRLIDQPAESAVTVENILAPHRERTLRRMRAHDTVLCIQDGTRLNFTRRSQTRGLGTIGSNQTGAAARGLDLHTTLAVNPDGVALGVLRAAFDAPEPPTPEEKGQPKPREERKSFRWVEGLRDCAAAAEQLGETRVVCTMDREADFLDLFIERRTHAPQVELLVRAKVDRVLGQQKTADGQTVSRRLFDEVRNAPARGAAMVEVRRLSARVKASKQPPKDGRAARVAEVTLRYQPVALPCPGTEPVELFVVHAREQQAPPAVEPLEWFVLTTLRVTSADDATRILGWYALRWRIEEYFRVLHPTRCHGLRFRTAGSIRMILQVQPPRSGARAGLACFIEVLRLANVPIAHCRKRQ